jgi:hypothetical protein
MKVTAFAIPVRATLVLALCATLLAGCESGTLTNHSQSCTSAGLFGAETVACSGSAGSVRGSVGFEFGGSDDEDELEGPYWLTATLSAGEGEANIYAYDAEDERVSLGRLSAGEPLRVEAVVQPSNGSVFFVDTGEGEIRDLRYEGRIEPI